MPYEDTQYAETFTKIIKSLYIYISRQKSGMYWIQVCRAATATVEISLCTR